MKKSFTTVFVLALSLLMIFTCACTKAPTTETAPVASGEAAAQTLRITGGTSGVETHPSAICGNIFCDYITENSDGRITFDFKHSRALGDEPELLQQVVDGTIPFCIVGTTTLTNINPVLDCFQLPFLVNNYELEEACLDMPEYLALQQAYEAQGVKVMGIIECGMFSIANNVKPITSVADLANLKIRTLSSDMATRTFSNMGANAIPIAYGEIYTSLQNGVIDGSATNWSSVYAEKFYEQLKYYTNIGLNPYAMCLCINLDFWNSLSAEDQKLFEEAIDIASRQSFVESKRLDDEAQQFCIEQGLQVNDITDVSEYAALQADLYEEAKASDPAVAAFITAVEAAKAK